MVRADVGTVAVFSARAMVRRIGVVGGVAAMVECTLKGRMAGACVRDLCHEGVRADPKGVEAVLSLETNSLQAPSPVVSVFNRRSSWLWPDRA